MFKKFILKKLFYYPLFHATLLFSQESKVDSLPAIEISIDKLSVKNSPYNVTTIKPQESINTNTSINELLNSMPGLFALSPNNYAQDTRISSRGFGARSSFGIRGIKVITDGFPDSTPDGQAQLDNVDFNSLQRIEMLKGPQAGIYGANSGGVLSLSSFNFYEKNSISVGTQLGAYNLFGLNGKAVFGNNKIKSSININRINWDGYREWSQYKNTVVNAYLSYRPFLNHHFDLLLNMVDSPIANDPGAVNLSELELGRMKARDRNILYKASENLSQQKYGFKYQFFRGNSMITAKAYFIKRDFSNFLPFSENGNVTIDRNINGYSLDYNFQFGNKKFYLENLIGFEFHNQNDLRRQFVNLNGLSGDKRFEQDEKFKNISYYFLTNASIFNHLKINFCLRNDQILTKAIDYYLSNGDQSGERNLSNLNYSTAITYGVKNTSISLLHCTGTESPTLNEFSNNPDGVGGFNYSLEAMQSKNYELNIKSDIANKLNFQFSIFNINTTDEILPYELINTPGRFYYRNTGSTKRNGLEFEASYKVFHNLSVKSSYTFSNFKFEDYQNLRDKYLPGIPKNLFFMELKYQFNERLKVLIEHKIIDEIFLNDLNEVTTPSFNETNIKCGYKYSIGKIETQINAGINNLLNSNYYSNIRINAAGGRYYEAAMPRYFFTAINFKL